MYRRGDNLRYKRTHSQAKWEFWKIAEIAIQKERIHLARYLHEWYLLSLETFCLLPSCALDLSCPVGKHRTTIHLNDLMLESMHLLLHHSPGWCFAAVHIFPFCRLQRLQFAPPTLANFMGSYGLFSSDVPWSQMLNCLWNLDLKPNI